MSTERLRRREALVVAGAVGAAALLRGTPVARLVGASTAPARPASTGLHPRPGGNRGPVHGQAGGSRAVVRLSRRRKRRGYVGAIALNVRG